MNDALKMDNIPDPPRKQPLKVIKIEKVKNGFIVTEDYDPNFNPAVHNHEFRISIYVFESNQKLNEYLNSEFKI